MSENAACAHLNASYRRKDNDDGTISGWWECDSDCGTRFLPAHFVASDELHQEYNQLESENAELKKYLKHARDDKKIRVKEIEVLEAKVVVLRNALKEWHYCMRQERGKECDVCVMLDFLDA